MINVVWAINNSFWDMGLPKYLLERAAPCKNYMGLPWANDAKADVGVIVIPGQHMTMKYEQLCYAAKQFERVVFFITGDEEAKFDASRLEHPNKKVWWFAPPFNPPQKVDRVLPFGWADGALQYLAEGRFDGHKERIFQLSFAGQVTHDRRRFCFAAANEVPGNKMLFPTKGFGQGIGREDYYRILLQSKYVPCPSGPCTPDSFRFAEALEAGCIPIADDLAPNPSYPQGYWSYLFGDKLPFPVIEDWSTLSDVIEDIDLNYDFNQRQCSSWWTTQKDIWVLKLMEDLCLT
jgi:hypothetical protein